MSITKLSHKRSAQILPIQFKQIEKEPQLSLHKSQHDQILKNINTSKTFLTRQIPISENIFNGFITLDKLNKEI